VQKHPFQELFFLDSSLFMFMADWRAATALFACIFLPLLLCSGGVFPLPLQKPRLFYSSVKKDTASIAVRRIFSIYMYESPHTAVTGYGGKYKNYYSSFS